jgi:hypothetical protein
MCSSASDARTHIDELKSQVETALATVTARSNPHLAPNRLFSNSRKSRRLEFRPGLACCGGAKAQFNGARGRHIDVRPNWKEQPPRPSLTGREWR